MDETRRSLLKGAAYLSAFGLPKLLAANEPRVTPFPLEAVRLRPSPYLTAVESNGVYLLRLEPDRLLHNFRVSAGLKPKGEVYGGWESESLAGHSLGHYLSACSLMFAQTGEAQYQIDWQGDQCNEAAGKRSENSGEDAPYDPHAYPGDAEEDRLKCVKAYEPVIFVGLYDY